MTYGRLTSKRVGMVSASVRRRNSMTVKTDVKNDCGNS
jgi:hypothetical protein